MSGSLTCHACGALNDCATSLNEPEARPRPGDVSVCFRCAAIAVFTGDGYATRPPDADERCNLLSYPAVIETAGAVLLFQVLDAE